MWNLPNNNSGIRKYVLRYQDEEEEPIRILPVTALTLNDCNDFMWWLLYYSPAAASLHKLLNNLKLLLSILSLYLLLLLPFLLCLDAYIKIKGYHSAHNY